MTTGEKESILKCIGPLVAVRGVKDEEDAPVSCTELAACFVQVPLHACMLA